jgi:hypothetical protein
MATNEKMCEKKRSHGRGDEWHGTDSSNISTNRAIQEPNLQAYAFHIFWSARVTEASNERPTRHGCSPTMVETVKYPGSVCSHRKHLLDG